MAATTLPPVSSLATLTPDARAAVLDLLFEPSPALHTVAASPILSTTAYPTYSALIAAVGAHLVDLLKSDQEIDQKRLDDILSSHPRLGEKKGPEAALSEMSRREQEAMRAAEGVGGAASESGQGQGQGQGSVEERLRALNDEYEATFARLKYVTFVNGRPRPVIMEDMERRIQRGDLNQERQDAIKAMCDIALDRVKKLGAE